MMAEKIETLREWLATYEDTASIGIDDGGLCLRVFEEDPYNEVGYFEIGGIPEENIMEDEDVC